MVLHRERRLSLHGQALDGVVVQVQVRHLGAAAERLGVDREAVVLRRDLDLAGREVLDWLVAAVVPELELEGAPAERETHDLVSQADAEDGDAAEELGDDLADAADGVRVAGAVREEDAVGMQAQDVARRRRRRDDADAAAGADQVPEDVELDAEVVRDDELWLAAAPGGGFLRPRVATAETPRPLVPVVRLGARDPLHQGAAHEARRLPRPPGGPLGGQGGARPDRL